MDISTITRPALGLTLALACGATARPALADDCDHHAHDGARLLDEQFAAAFLANDVDAAVALYDESGVLFNIGGPPAVGPAAIRAALSGFLGAFEVKAFTHSEQHYVTSGDLSTGWALFTITVAPRGGGPAFDIRGRSTIVAQRSHGQWRFLHDHASLPSP